MARQKAEQGSQGEPAYYVAAQDILIGHPESGQMPVAAYRAGDRVEPDVVESNGWHDQVRRPDEEAPAQDAGPSTPPQYQTTAGSNQVVTEPGTPAEGEGA